MSEPVSIDSRECLEAHNDLMNRLLPSVCQLPNIVLQLARDDGVSGDDPIFPDAWEEWIPRLAEQWSRFDGDHWRALANLNAYVCKLRRGEPVRLTDPKNPAASITAISWHDLIYQARMSQSLWLRELNAELGITLPSDLLDNLCGLPFVLPQDELSPLLQSEFHWARLEWQAEHPGMSSQGRSPVDNPNGLSGHHPFPKSPTGDLAKFIDLLNERESETPGKVNITETAREIVRRMLKGRTTDEAVDKAAAALVKKRQRYLDKMKEAFGQ